ncbi:hypothetical protein B0O44_103623 [Pedobacter nutrimenti]|jgi:hypothetical protein|uniref:Uncharacterized protein n=1 Tax=Pedobacter nutrimenti TaxID=1241337 RepID=A0A318UGA7_9SPHI|nr:hypothetical protein B0O44_103623 [Pedobacter nutrimenti]
MKFLFLKEVERGVWLNIGFYGKKKPYGIKFDCLELNDHLPHDL